MDRETNYTECVERCGLTVHQLICNTCFVCLLSPMTERKLNQDELELFHKRVYCHSSALLTIDRVGTYNSYCRSGDVQ